MTGETVMDSAGLRAIQAPLKEQYRASPDAALIITTSLLDASVVEPTFNPIVTATITLYLPPSIPQIPALAKAFDSPHVPPSWPSRQPGFCQCRRSGRLQLFRSLC